jgi:TRAP-type C4-dicarboxylate transport system substrate-binding protein
MNYSRALKSAISALVMIFLYSSCGKLSDHRTLKLAHGLPTDHPVHLAMDFMAERCKEVSDGKLQIEIYAGGQLGSEQQCVELLQIGSLAITKVSAAVMESFTDDYKVLGLPYIFRDKEHAFQVFRWRNRTGTTIEHTKCLDSWLVFLRCRQQKFLHYRQAYSIAR